MIAKNGLRQAFNISRGRLLVSNSRRLLSTRPLYSFNASNIPSPLISSQFKLRPGLPGLATARFNSTSANTAGASFPPLVPDEAAPLDVNTSFYDIDAGTFLSEIPEKIGFLKELGLEYGWGPTSTVQWLLEHVYIYTDLPWWASIIATAVAVRLALIPAFIRAADTTARMAIVKPKMMPITKEMNEAKANKDTAAMMAAQQKMMALYRLGGIKFSRAFVPMILQGAIGFGTFRLTRGMANLPVPSLEDGGALWFTDLTVPDPLYILPLSMAAVLHLLFKAGGETGNPADVKPGMRTLMLWGLPGITFAFGIWWPALLQLSMLSGSLLGALQATLFRNPAVRDLLGISPMPPKDSEADKTSKFVRNWEESQKEPKPKKGLITDQIETISEGATKTWSGFKETIHKQMGSIPKKPGQRSANEQREAERYEKKRSKEESLAERERKYLLEEERYRLRQKNLRKELSRRGRKAEGQ